MTHDNNKLRQRAQNIRKNIIEMIFKAKSGHPGGSLSIADILTVLFENVLKYDPANPKWEDRDRLVLSKGHAAPALYAALYEFGYFDKAMLNEFRQIGGRLQGHPDSKKTPGIEVSTGSLGQGLSITLGMAWAAKLLKKDVRIYAILGDGEIQEGQVWEAAMAIAHFKLNNVTAFVDYNNLQIDGPVSQVMDPWPIDDKFKAFGWNVYSINGHDFEAIEDAIQKSTINPRPTMIVAHTIKGKGASYFEGKLSSHHIANMSAEIYQQSIQDIEHGMEGK